METESEPYVRLSTLRQLHQVVADLNTARSLADTLQTVADGVVAGLNYELACVNLVRPDGDLVVAAFAGSSAAEALITGRVGSRASWERRLSMATAWGDLRFIPHTEGWVLMEDDVPQWHTDGPAPRFEDEWHPHDRLYAPMYASGSGRELLGVISVDRPRNGRHPGPWGQEALQMYASQSAIAISNARLRSNMQRALVRLEREQQALRASEESFRQAFEYAPSGMAIAEMGGDQHGRLLRTNDALCRLLGRPASVMRRYSFADLVHPEDIGTLLRTSAEGGRAELRLGRRDGTYVWVSLRNSVVADTADGPRFLLTHVEDIEERKRHELQLAHRASHDALTGLPNSAELRSRLSARLCERPAAHAAADQAAGYGGGYESGRDGGYGTGQAPGHTAYDSGHSGSPGYESPYEHEHEHGFGFEPRAAPARTTTMSTSWPPPVVTSTTVRKGLPSSSATSTASSRSTTASGTTPGTRSSSRSPAGSPPGSVTGTRSPGSAATSSSSSPTASARPTPPTWPYVCATRSFRRSGWTGGRSGSGRVSASAGRSAGCPWKRC